MGRKYPAIGQSWRRNWEAVIPFFAFPAEVRKIIYTTNAIESLSASVRKAIRNKGHLPNGQAATKLIGLALRHITENWKRPPVAWQAAKAQSRYSSETDSTSTTDAAPQAARTQKNLTRPSLDEARTRTASWLPIYNEQRIHSAIGHLPPIAFKQRWQQQQSLLSTGSG
jgi:transposase InsO family protein